MNIPNPYFGPGTDNPMVDLEQQRFMTKVYGWMCIGLLVTGLISWVTYNTPALTQLIFGNQAVFFGALILEFILVAVLVGMVEKMQPSTATIMYLLYAVINGLTLSVVFLVYTMNSITLVFYITSATFGIMSFYGYTTKKDLTSWGSFLFMGLLGIIIASLINFWFRNAMFDWIITIIGVIVFVGLTAYDTQKIKMMNVIGNEGTPEDHKEAIMGALTLYLDYINLFLKLLRLLGKKK